MTPTTDRELWPTLPTPERLIVQDDEWRYEAPSTATGYGLCKLAVFTSSDGGHIAIVTELTAADAKPGEKPYDGLWIATGAPDIWRALVDAYDTPLTLLEHTRSATAGDVFDQYTPAYYNSNDRRPISHIAPAHPDYDDVRTWWLAYRDYLTTARIEENATS